MHGSSNFIFNLQLWWLGGGGGSFYSGFESWDFNLLGLGRMAHSTGRTRVVADYLVGRQIGSGSFSVVWHARHRVHGTEVAIKEISMSRLSKKLQDSLMSEIFILKRINHPNIIRLFDIIEVSV